MLWILLNTNQLRNKTERTVFIYIDPTVMEDE